VATTHRVSLQALFTVPLELDNGKAFFDALNRVETIRVECKQLISSALQSAGIEILEDMAHHQEAAFDRLFKWVQEQCQLLTQDAPDFDSGDKDVQPLLRAALRILSARPSYLKYVPFVFSLSASARTGVSVVMSLSDIDISLVCSADIVETASLPPAVRRWSAGLSLH
jgi:hypothetical protein